MADNVQYNTTTKKMARFRLIQPAKLKDSYYFLNKPRVWPRQTVYALW